MGSQSPRVTTFLHGLPCFAKFIFSGLGRQDVVPNTYPTPVSLQWLYIKIYMIYIYIYVYMIFRFIVRQICVISFEIPWWSNYILKTDNTPSKDFKCLGIRLARCPYLRRPSQPLDRGHQVTKCWRMWDLWLEKRKLGPWHHSHGRAFRRCPAKEPHISGYRNTNLYPCH